MYTKFVMFKKPLLQEIFFKERFFLLAMHIIVGKNNYMKKFLYFIFTPQFFLSFILTYKTQYTCYPKTDKQ